MPTLQSSKPARAALALLFIGVLAACGGGGDSDPAPGGGTPPPPAPPPPTPVAGPRWISSAAQIDLLGGADSGIDGPLLVVDPGRPDSPAALTPGAVDSTSVRILGGKVDATLSTVESPGPRFVVYDAPAPGGTTVSFSLYKLALDSVGTAAPAPERISSETTICGSLGARFRVIGQSLTGDEALISYLAPDSNGNCGDLALPRLMKLSMGRTAAPIVLPVAEAERLTPIGAIHGSSGQVAAVLAWQNGHFVRADGSLANPLPLADADVVGTPMAPSGPGIVTRFGIFIKSADGLRRYDKSTGKVSALLLAGQVDAGAQVNDLYDEQGLYVTVAQPGGALDLYRISDTLAPVVTKINEDGPLHPWGFRVLKSSVLYAVDGRDDFTAWRKADGQRSSVLAGKRVVMSSLLSDRVFHTTTDDDGKVTLATSDLDGGNARSFGEAQLASGALATQATPFARSLRANGAFSHAIVVAPEAGKSDLTGGSVRWISFGDAAQDIDAGSLPATLALGNTLQAPGIVAEAGLFSVRKAVGTDAYVFASRRAAASLVRIANGVQ